MERCPISLWTKFFFSFLFFFLKKKTLELLLVGERGRHKTAPAAEEEEEDFDWSSCRRDRVPDWFNCRFFLFFFLIIVFFIPIFFQWMKLKTAVLSRVFFFGCTSIDFTGFYLVFFYWDFSIFAIFVIRWCQVTREPFRLTPVSLWMLIESNYLMWFGFNGLDSVGTGISFWFSFWFFWSSGIYWLLPSFTEFHRVSTCFYRVLLSLPDATCWWGFT